MDRAVRGDIYHNEDIIEISIVARVADGAWSGADC